MSLWNQQSAAEATQGKAQGAWSASRVEIDSRKLQPGELFVAIKGERFDGHAFVKDALAKGAAAAVVSRIPEGLADGAPLLVVDDTMTALEDLARAARKRTMAKIIGVTGSVGKTSAKEMLRLALSAHGTVHATSGNYNNHIGTPLNLANMPPDCDFAVLEMGMNHAGEISHLSLMVQPHVAVITTVEAVHLEFFESVTGIADAKAEIFDGLAEGGTAVLNADNAYLHRLMAQAAMRRVPTVMTFGAHIEADARLTAYRPSQSGCDIEAVVFGKELRYTLGTTGKHWAMTSLLVLTVAEALGLDVAKTAAALAPFTEVEGRGRLMPLTINQQTFWLINDSYNASPAAVKAAFARTAELWETHGARGRRIAVLGDMLELGADGPYLHAALAEEAIRAGFDKIYTAGELMRYLHDALPEALRGAHVANADQLLPIMLRELGAGDMLLVKGSHGSKMYALADALIAQAAGAKEKKHAV